MLHHEDRHSLVSQEPGGIQRVLGGGGVEAGQRLIQQQNGRPHGQHACQRHLLFFAA
jgi:hypothetical protein